MLTFFCGLDSLQNDNKTRENTGIGSLSVVKMSRVAFLGWEIMDTYIVVSTNVSVDNRMLRCKTST